MSRKSLSKTSEMNQLAVPDDVSTAPGSALPSPGEKVTTTKKSNRSKRPREETSASPVPSSGDEASDSDVRKLQLRFDAERFSVSAWNTYYAEEWIEKCSRGGSNGGGREMRMEKVRHRPRFTRFQSLLPSLLWPKFSEMFNDHARGSGSDGKFLTVCKAMMLAQLENDFGALLDLLGYNPETLELQPFNTVCIGGEYWQIALRHDPNLWSLLHEDRIESSTCMHKMVKPEPSEHDRQDEVNLRLKKILENAANRTKGGPSTMALLQKAIDRAHEQDRIREEMEEANEDDDDEDAMLAKAKNKRRPIARKNVDSSIGYDFSHKRKQIRELGASRQELKHTNMYRHQRELLVGIVTNRYLTGANDCLDIQFKYGGYGGGIIQVKVDVWARDKLDSYAHAEAESEEPQPASRHLMWLLCMTRKQPMQAKAIEEDVEETAMEDAGDESNSTRPRRGEAAAEEKATKETSLMLFEPGNKRRKLDEDRKQTLIQSDETRLIRSEVNTNSIGCKYDDTFDPATTTLLWFSQSCDIRSDICMSIMEQFQKGESDVVFAVKSQDTNLEWRELGSPLQIRIHRLAQLTIARGETVIRSRKRGGASRLKLHKIGSKKLMPLCGEIQHGRSFADFDLRQTDYDGHEEKDLETLRQSANQDGVKADLSECRLLANGDDSKWSPNDCCIYCGWQTASLSVQFPDTLKNRAQQFLLGWDGGEDKNENKYVVQNPAVGNKEESKPEAKAKAKSKAKAKPRKEKVAAIGVEGMADDSEDSSAEESEEGEAESDGELGGDSESGESDSDESVEKAEEAAGSVSSCLVGHPDVDVSADEDSADEASPAPALKRRRSLVEVEVVVKEPTKPKAKTTAPKAQAKKRGRPTKRG